jgi:hypothetical protein
MCLSSLWMWVWEYKFCGKISDPGGRPGAVVLTVCWVNLGVQPGGSVYADPV